MGEAKDSSYLIGKIHCTYTKVLALSKIPIQKNKVNKENLLKGEKSFLPLCFKSAAELSKSWAAVWVQ